MEEEPKRLQDQETTICSETFSVKSVSNILQDQVIGKVNRFIKPSEEEKLLIERYVGSIFTGPKYGLSLRELTKLLTHENFMELQKRDRVLSILRERIQNGEVFRRFYIFKDLLMSPNRRTETEDKGRIVVPQYLVPAVLALYHMRQHLGKNRLYAAIQVCYFWANMTNDMAAFAKGCMLCSEQKASTIGPPVIGAIQFFDRLEAWKIDIIDGLGKASGYNTLLNCVEIFSGYICPNSTHKQTQQENRRTYREVHHQQVWHHENHQFRQHPQLHKPVTTA